MPYRATRRSQCWSGDRKEQREYIGHNLYSLGKCKACNINSLGLASLKSSNKFWSIGTVSSSLAPHAGMFQRKYSFDVRE